MYTPILPFLSLLLALLTPINAVNHTTSPWIADTALDALIALNPHSFGDPSNTASTGTTATARLRPRDSIRRNIPIPNDPH
ncbi:MAG: hypothetical protein Q9218_006004, partial [Villophora microphyllina]